jgi:hypothetical protein
MGYIQGIIDIEVSISDFVQVFEEMILEGV